MLNEIWVIMTKKCSCLFPYEVNQNTPTPEVSKTFLLNPGVTRDSRVTPGLPLFSKTCHKDSKNIAAEIIKNYRFWPPTVVWGPLATQPPWISAWTLYRVKAESLSYILPLRVWVYLFFQISVVSSKRRIICAVECDTAVEGHPRSLILLSIETPHDLLLVITSNRGVILHRFWETATYWLNIANFPYPSFSALYWGNPFRNSRKASRILKLKSFTESGEILAFLGCSVWIESQSGMDRQRDRQPRPPFVTLT